VFAQLIKLPLSGVTVDACTTSRLSAAIRTSPQLLTAAPAECHSRHHGRPTCAYLRQWRIPPHAQRRALGNPVIRRIGADF
jgi:hypothetical protein